MKRKNRTLFITGIGTEIGKTFISSILTEYLQADYWKPIQSGDLEYTDTMRVKSLISNKKSKFHSEAYRLTHPLSPHASAKRDNTLIELQNINLPQVDNHLIIEGAGGILVPINHDHLIIDLIEKLKPEVIIVSKNYLGSINHTLLTINELKRRNIAILGVVFNGETTPETEEIIQHFSKLNILFRTVHEKNVNKETILKYTKTINL
jgi:dethiobiotin synthetase